ncbi:MAG TPA: hypothetical protein VIM11_10105 [Tepidisphaeraceae bacterium]
MPLLLRQIKVVLMSYATRAVLQLMLLAVLLGYGLFFGLEKLMSYYPSPYSSVVRALLETLVTLLTMGGAFILILLFFLQAREQLMGLRARLMPEARTAHLIAIGILFAGITVTVSSVWWERPTNGFNTHWDWRPGISPVGQTVVVLVYMTLAAYAVYNPWLLPILAAMLILGIRNSPVRNVISDIRIWYPDGKLYSEATRETSLLNVLHQLRTQNALYLRAIVFLINLIAIQVLVWLARPKRMRRGFAPAAMDHIMRSLSSFQSHIVSVTPHVPMTSMVSRGRHRRNATRSQRAPWVLSGGSAVLLVGLLWLMGFHASENIRLCIVLVMITLLPGAVVATAWRERWLGLGYESLFPSGREQFVKEIAVGLATDLAEFWVAVAISSIAVLALFGAQALLNPSLIVSLVASLMMQILWIGAIFLASWFRQVVPYVVLLTGVGLAMLIPLFELFQNHRLLGMRSFLLIALAEMACGIIFLLSGMSLWRKADLA